MTKIADAINKKDSSGNYTVMGWMPGGPGAGGNAGAFDQGWHYTWGFDYGGKFADLAACKVTPTDPGRRRRLSVPVRLGEGPRSAGREPLGHDQPASEPAGRPEPVLDRQARP